MNVNTIVVKHDEYGDILPEVPVSPAIIGSRDSEPLEPIIPPVEVSASGGEELCLAIDEDPVEDVQNGEDLELAIDESMEDDVKKYMTTPEYALKQRTASEINKYLRDNGSKYSFNVRENTIYVDGTETEIGEYSVSKRGSCVLLKVIVDNSTNIGELRKELSDASDAVSQDIHKNILVVINTGSVVSTSADVESEDLELAIDHDTDICPECGNDPCTCECDAPTMTEDNKKPNRAVSRVIAAISEYEMAMDIIRNTNAADEKTIKSFTARADAAAKKAQDLIDTEDLTDNQRGSLQTDLNNTIKYYGKPDGMKSESNKVSKIYTSESGRKFRYNYDTAELQYISSDEKTVLDTIGLSKSDWEESPLNAIEQYEYNYLDPEFNALKKEFGHLLDNIDQELVDKYAGKKIVLKDDTTVVYNCSGINPYNELVLYPLGSDKSDDPIFASVDDVYSAEGEGCTKLSKCEQRIVNRFLNKVLRGTQYENENQFKSAVRKLTTSSCYTENMIKFIEEGFGDRYMAKADKRNKKSMCTSKLADAINNVDLPKEIHAALTRLIFSTDDYNKIYSIMFPSQDRRAATEKCVTEDTDIKIIKALAYNYGMTDDEVRERIRQGDFNDAEISKSLVAYDNRNSKYWMVKVLPVDKSGPKYRRLCIKMPTTDADEAQKMADQYIYFPYISYNVFGTANRDAAERDGFEIVESVTVRVNEGNPVSNKLSPSIDEFLTDIAQMYGTIDYNDIIDHEYSSEDIRRLKNLRSKAIRNADNMSDDDFTEYMNDKVIPQIADIFRKNIKESVTVTHHDWSMTTGKEYPRGEMKWKFKFYPGGSVKSFDGTFSQAKRLAIKYAEDNGFSSVDAQG